MSYKKEDIIRMVKVEDIEFIRLQFTDIFGQLKNVAITASQIEKAVNNQIMFDGSSIEGFVRIDESDQYLYPDLDSFVIFPWRPSHGRVARLICDVHNPDGTPFKGDPDFDYEHGISIPYVVAAGNPNVLHYYTMTEEDAAYSYLALFAVTAGSVVSIELSGVSGPSIVCNKPGGNYSFALIANPVLNGKVNFRHGGTGDGHVFKLMIK